MPTLTRDCILVSLGRSGALFVLLLWLGSVHAAEPEKAPAPATAHRVGERLFLWGHVAGAYNDSYCKNLGESKIEPVDAANYMGLRNMYFIRFNYQPALPLSNYFIPFKKLDQVYWSLTGSAGATSQEERDAVFSLAEANRNVVGFIMDDFFRTDLIAPPQWLAADPSKFPVSVTMVPPRPTVATTLTLGQSKTPDGRYRTRDVAIELTVNGTDWREIGKVTLPNEPAAKVAMKLPSEAFAGVRARILNSYDAATASSCGLSLFELTGARKRINDSSWKVTASSSREGYSPETLLERDKPLPASLSPEQLLEIRKRLPIDDRKLRLSVVVYTGQISERATHHLQYVDEISLWTWRPDDLVHLEENLVALERLAPDKRLVLGCYMFDFSRGIPLGVEPMKRQLEIGYRWLQQGRIQGMILLASPICDLRLEAVEFSRKWVASVRDLPLQRGEAVPQ